MAELSDIATLTVISSDRANDWQDRLVQRYSSVANRVTEHPSPTEGDLSYLEDSNTVWVYDGAAWMLVAGPGGSTPTGAIEMFGGTSAPAGWVLAQGQAISRTTFAALFGVIGTTYGAGDGSTTFNVPNLAQRFPLGKAVSGTGATLGSTGGTIDHTHAGTNHQHPMPHTHTVDPPNTNTSSALDSGLAIGGQEFKPESPQLPHRHTVDIVQFNSGGVSTPNTSAGGTGATGTGNPPFQVVNYIVKT